MKRTVSLFEFMPYGAPELLASDRPHLARALMLSSLFATLLFLAAWPMLARIRMAPRVVEFAFSTRPAMPRPILEPPPPDIVDGPPPVLPLPPGAIPLPVPVAPDAPVVADPPTPGTEYGESARAESGPIAIEAAPGPVEDVLPPRGTVVPVDELPAEISQFKPEYPSIAREAGVEGLVVVHALIGKDGRVIRAEVDSKHSIPLLDETAREAALKWRFTPAWYQGRPVAVWYAIPFRFVLNDPGR